MATQYTSLLGLALPVTGELSGSWGDVVNDSITSLLDTAVAGTTTLSTDGDVTLSTTTGASNQARQSILLCSGARTALRTITAPAQSKIYTVINATTGGYSVKVVGSGPTTGVTIVAGESAVIAWNGSDFIKVSNTGGSASFTNVTVSGTTTLSGLTASTALALNSSKEVVSVTNTGTGNNVLSASPTLTGTISGANASLSGTLAVTGVATLTAQPILSSLTASQAVFTDGSKGLVSNAITGTGNVVMSASPTLTGTVAGASLQLSSLTSGRVTYAGASGLLQDSANLTFNGTDLTVSGAVNAGTINATTLDLTNLEVTNIKAKDGTAGMQIADSTGVVSFTANPVISGGTANGVAYLNGSKVLTTGSALTFDGTGFGVVTSAPTLTVFETASGNNNRLIISQPGTVTTYNSTYSSGSAAQAWQIANTEGMRLTSTGLGIGTSAPGYKLTVAGTQRIQKEGAGYEAAMLSFSTLSETGAIYRIGMASGGSLAIGRSDTNTTNLTLDVSGNLGIGTSSPASLTKLTVFQDSTFAVQLMNSSQNYTLRVDAGASDALILGNRTSFTDLLAISTSGNLGIGTSSPREKLDVAGNIAAPFSDNSTIQFQYLTGSSYGLGMMADATNRGLKLFTRSADGVGYISFSTGGMTERMRLDYSGNLGLGVTPSAWGSGKGFEIGAVGNGVWGGSGFLNLMQNTAFTSGAYRYVATATAARHEIEGNVFKWFIAPSGTAGNAISFTQAMTLSAAGGLSVGTTTDAGAGNILINASKAIYGNATSGSFYSYLELYNGSTGNTNLYNAYAGGAITFATAGTERMRLDSSGNLGLGVTPSAWSAFKAFEISAAGNALWSAGSNDIRITTNHIYNLGDKYVTTGRAAEYIQTAGTHQWYTAPSGTAGNAISFTQAMTLDASGRLNIGTTGGSSTLNISGASSDTWAASSTDGLAFNGNASGVSTITTFLDGSSLRIGSGTTQKTGILITGQTSGSGSTVQFSTGGSERARIDSSGNLLINNTYTTASKLIVAGTGTSNAAYAGIFCDSGGSSLLSLRNDGYIDTGTRAVSPYNNTTASAANMFVDSTGGLYRSTSSLKYKTDVQNATHGLSEVMQLRPVTYKGKTDGDTIFGGLIAEEVHAAGLTEFVHYAEDGSPDALAYGNMVSLCIKAIQEQQAIIESLKARLDAANL